MNHEEATKYLDDLGDRVPNRRPPINDLIRAGQAAQRRKTNKTLAVLAIAAALVAASGVAVQQWVTSDDGAVDHAITDTPSAPSTTSLPGEAPVAVGPCPPAPPSSGLADQPGVPAPRDAEGATVNETGTVAAWFEPTTGPLPFLVVYDLVGGTELAREDLGVGDNLRSASLRIDEHALYYRSSADADVWMQYRWGIDDYPAVYTICTG